MCAKVALKRIDSKGHKVVLHGPNEQQKSSITIKDLWNNKDPKGREILCEYAGLTKTLCNKSWEDLGYGNQQCLITAQARQEINSTRKAFQGEYLG